MTLGQAVDLVIEEQDIQVEIAAQQMDSMVAADAEAVAIAGYHPDAEIRTTGLETRCDRRRPAMDRMHSIGIHVIGETAAAADTGNYHNILPGYSERRHDLLHLGQDGIIAASGAPAHFLIRCKILCCQG